MRGTTNSNVRGNTKNRAARKRYLLKAYAADKARQDPPNWEPIPACRCYRCGALLTFETITVDRIIPGCKGGKYVRNNIRPSCARCNFETGGALRRGS